MNKSRWFLAHSKNDEDSNIDAWCAEVRDLMSDDLWQAEVTSGRDDYKSRASALGGWSAWCRDVSIGESYTGDPMFHGIVVPVNMSEQVSVGKATAQLVEGFISRKKHAYAWCVCDKVFKSIVGVQPIESDDWVSWSVLILEDPT